VPANVKQQIELWEKELNCIKSRKVMMVILNTRETAQRFCDYAGLRNIVIFKQAGLKFVIDIKHEKEAIEF